MEACLRLELLCVLPFRHQPLCHSFLHTVRKLTNFCCTWNRDRVIASLPPSPIVPTLADRGQYLASESSFYRVLRSASQQHHRGRARKPSARVVTSHCATGPNQVWSWVITWMPAAIMYQYYYWYMMLDVAKARTPERWSGPTRNWSSGMSLPIVKETTIPGSMGLCSMEEGGNGSGGIIGRDALKAHLKVKRFLRGYKLPCAAAQQRSFKDRSLVSPSQKCETTPDACGVRQWHEAAPEP